MSLTRLSSSLRRAGSLTLPALLLASASALFGCVEAGEDVATDETAAEPLTVSTLPPIIILQPMKRTFNGDTSGDDACHAIAARSDDSFVVTGELRRIVQGHNAVIRGYDNGGTLLWNREINTPSEGHDRGNDVLALADNTSITAGTWLSGASGYNYFLDKLNSAGSTLWWRESELANHDKYLGVAMDAAGSLYVTGVKPDAGGSGQAWIRKLASDGNTQVWENVRNGTSTSAPDAANKVGVDASGNVYVVGYVDDTATSTGRDGYISKFSSSGTWLTNTWVWSYGHDDVTDVGVAGDGSLAVAAKLDTSGSVRKYNAAGTLVWATSDATITWRGVTIDSSGNVYATGSEGTNMITRKFAAADGAIQWTRTQANASGEGIALDGSGRTLVCGSETAAEGGTDGLIMRYPW